MRAGYDVVVCRDPGSTPLGERIRDVLLTSDAGTPIGRRSEMLLYMAARAQLVDEVIRPALDAGKIVVADRICWRTSSTRVMRAGWIPRRFGKSASWRPRA